MQDLEIAFAGAVIGLLERRARTDQALCAFLRQPHQQYPVDPQLETAADYLNRYLPSLSPQSPSAWNT